MEEEKSTKEKLSKLRTLANWLTTSRGLTGLPVILSLSMGAGSIAWVLILIGGISDVLDGWLARKAGGGSEWGARFAPLSDKILLSAPFIWLASQSVLPTWAVWILISREIVVSGWRSKSHKGGPASRGGKAKTILQFISILLLLWPTSWLFSQRLQIIGWYIFWPSLLISLTSAKSYLKGQ